MHGRLPIRRFLIAICLSTTVLLPGCATVKNPVTGKTERTVMDERSEMAEGAKAHPDDFRQRKLIFGGEFG